MVVAHNNGYVEDNDHGGQDNDIDFHGDDELIEIFYKLIIEIFYRFTCYLLNLLEI